MRSPLIAPTLLTLASLVPATGADHLSPFWGVNNGNALLQAQPTPASSSASSTGFTALSLASSVWQNTGNGFAMFSPSTTNGLMITGLNTNSGIGHWEVDGNTLNLGIGEAYFLAMAGNNSSSAPVLRYIADDSDDLNESLPQPAVTVYLVENIAAAYADPNSEGQIPYFTHPQENFDLNIYDASFLTDNGAPASSVSRTIIFPLIPQNDPPGFISNDSTTDLGHARVAITNSNFVVTSEEFSSETSVLDSTRGMNIQTLLGALDFTGNTITDPDTPFANLGITLTSTDIATNAGTWVWWQSDGEIWYSTNLIAEGTTSWNLGPNDYLQFVPNSFTNRASSQTVYLSGQIWDGLLTSGDSFSCSVTLDANQLPVVSGPSDVGAFSTSGSFQISISDPDSDFASAVSVGFLNLSGSSTSYSASDETVSFSGLSSNFGNETVEITPTDDLGEIGVPIQVAVHQDTAPSYTDSRGSLISTTAAAGGSPITFTWTMSDRDVAGPSPFVDALTLNIFDNHSESSISVPLNGDHSQILNTSGGGTLQVLSYQAPSNPDTPIDGQVVLRYTPPDSDSPPESFSTNLTDTAGGSAQRDIAITVASLPFIGVAATGSLIENSASNTGAFNIIRSQADDHITVSYTVSGSATSEVDYIPLSGTVDLPIGQYVATIPVQTIGDLLPEGDEDIKVTLSDVTPVSDSQTLTTSQGERAQIQISTSPLYTLLGGTIPPDTQIEALQPFANPTRPLKGFDSLTIFDDDPIVGVTTAGSGSPTIAEPATNGTVMFVRTLASGQLDVTYTLGGSATPGTDYELRDGATVLSGTVSFADGEYAKAITVAVMDDAVDDAGENITISLNTTDSYTIGGTLSENFPVQNLRNQPIQASTTFTIADNDSPPAPPAVTPVTLAPDQVPIVQQVVSAPNETPKFFSFAANSPDALASLKAALAGKDNTQVRGFSWDAKNQVYVELPAEPEGGLTRDNAVFLVTRIDLGLVQGTTTYTTPYTVTLKPGWNFIGVPVMTLGDGTVASSHPWANFDAGSADISSAFQWTGSEYVIASNLVVGTGYWVKNRTTGDVALIRKDAPVAKALLATRSVTHDTPPPPPSAGVAAQADGGACGTGSGIGLLLGFGWLARLGLRSRRRLG